MKAIILAGGEGTRLHPISIGRPKPMTRVLDKPLLEHTVRLLRNNGVTDICMTLRYLPQMIIDYFGDGRDRGVNIDYRVEDQPLGTAGGVLACRDFIGEDDFLIVSGDAALNANLSNLVKFHSSRKAIATLALYRCGRPYEYGLVLTDSRGRVTGFVEKPSRDRVVTDLVNTGIYVMSPELLERIPAGTPCDFARDLFPKLLAEGANIYAQELDGYWLDIGSCGAYLRANTDALTLSGRSAYIADSAVVEPGAVIGPLAVIGSGSVVRSGAKVYNSVVDGAEVGARSVVRGAVLCKGAKLGADSRILRGGVLGENAEVGAGSYIADGVRVFPNCSVPAGSRVCEHIVSSPASTRAFELSADGVIAGELTPERLLTLGARIAAISPRIGFAGSDAELIAAAAYRLGCQVYTLDAQNAAIAAFAGRAYKFGITVYAEPGYVRLTDAFGLPPERDTERKLNSDAVQIKGVHRARQTITGTGELYRVTVGNLPERFTLSEDCLTASLTDEGGRVHDWARLLAALTLAECEHGSKAVTLPYDAPAVCEEIAHGSVLRLGRDEPEARAQFLQNPHTSDGTMLAVRLAELIVSYGSYAELMRRVPEICVGSAELPISELQAGRVMRKLAASYADSVAAEYVSGVRLDLGGGRTVRVVPSAGALKVFAEARSLEAASELCGDLTDKLKALCAE